jgi:hypothetical protein
MPRQQVCELLLLEGVRAASERARDHLRAEQGNKGSRRMLVSQGCSWTGGLLLKP